MSAHVCTHTHTHTHMCTHACTQTYMHTDTYLHTYTHIHTDAHTCAYRVTSNAHKTGHSVEVTNISPYQVSANLHPKKPLPQSKRNRTQTAPSKPANNKDPLENPFERTPSDEKPDKKEGSSQVSCMV